MPLDPVIVMVFSIGYLDAGAAIVSTIPIKMIHGSRTYIALHDRDHGIQCKG